MGRTLKTDPPASILDGGNFRQNFVKVETDKGSLRLRFSHGGKRYAMAIGLPDSKINRLVAQQKATQIELDIASGNFDDTLKNYKPPRASAKKAAEATVVGLFTKFMAAQTKEKELQVGSLCRYTATLRHLETFFPKTLAETVDAKSAKAFAKYLKRNVAERTAKDYLILVQSCWAWVDSNLEDTPWPSVLSKVKPAPKQKVKPFTTEEVKAILAEFRTNRYYQHYADFVTFLFGTGCRFGEVVALKWKHIANSAD